MAVSIGDVFGRLTIIEFSHKDKWYKKYWRCQCQCGNITTVIERCLLNGETKSCGCLCKETRNSFARTHGKSGKKIYAVWYNMITRCEYPKCKSFKDYGGRGIKVCTEWHSSDSFFLWAENNGYQENLELDRKDVNGDYCPENCRFITKKENANNKRNNHYITVQGEIHTLSTWAKIQGCNPSTISERIKRGMVPEEAIFGGK
jgi:hypothetical protein